jgi:hypothetical protein
MNQVLIDVSDNKFNFFMELVDNPGFKKVKQASREQQQFVDDLQHSLEQVKQHQEGKIKLQSAKGFLDEL